MSIRQVKSKEHIACPFCGEPDYDLVGLKMHLVSGPEWLRCPVFIATSESFAIKNPASKVGIDFVVDYRS